jgi:hypothetical protein
MKDENLQLLSIIGEDNGNDDDRRRRRRAAIVVDIFAGRT